MLIPYPKPVDKLKYSNKNNVNLNAFYGLPKKVIFCKSCVISNQRPSSSVEFKSNSEKEKSTIHFDESGICDACRVKQKKDQIGKKEKKKCGNCVINFEARMVNMIV